jgi:hypothetical protein
MSNWYIKLAMPLPPAKGYPKPLANGKHNGGLGDLDHRMDEDEAESISKQYPSMKYLGHGVDGVAYTHKVPNSVIKITNSYEEADVAMQIMNDPVPCCVRVFNVQENQSTTWTIEVEKVQPLAPAEKLLFGRLFLKYKGKPVEINLKDPETQKFAIHWKRLVSCLKQNNLSAEDAHANNIGWNKEGVLVLFDLGNST